MNRSRALGGLSVAAALALLAGCGSSGGGGPVCGEVPGTSNIDGDGDGVLDEEDLCDGFDDRIDHDLDGVPDGCDLCPAMDDSVDADGDGLPDPCDDEPMKADWVRTATVGGASMFREARRLEIEAILNPLVDQGVSVVEADSDLSLYLSDEEFEQELTLIQATSELAHIRGMKVVWYYPTLEVITKNGRIEESSMFKDYPEWVQRSIGVDNEPNVFYGDLAFWVDPDDESAWMDPLTGYRDYYLDRVRKLAATDLDGLWLDVPLLNDIVGVWPSHTPESRARFLADTGFEAPADPDTGDPAWWIWLDWRHKIVAEFLRDIYTAAREVDPEFVIIVENVTLDYNSSILQGLDGTFSEPLPDYSFVWELDVTSESDGMIYSTPDDWITLIAMLKFGRGVFPESPSWAFTYGNVPDDAEMVMAESLATQNSPYELKAPEMTTTVDPDYRARMFNWAQEHRDLLFRSESAARIAVIQSSASRDLVDGSCLVVDQCGVALYANTNRPEGLREEASWWADDLVESIYSTDYMADYRGLAKALVQLHRPFDVVPLRNATADQLARYDALLVPDLQALSTAEANRLTAYVEAGGRVLFTGPKTGAHNTVGVEQATNMLEAILDADQTSGCTDTTAGDGATTRCVDRIGKAYFNDSDPAALETIAGFLDGAVPRAIVTDAPANVHFEIYRRGDKLVVHAVNFTGADGWVEVQPITFRLSVDLAGADEPCRVVSLSPRAGTEILPYQIVDGRVEVDVTLDIYEMIVIAP
jgi:hypothetical protein